MSRKTPRALIAAGVHLDLGVPRAAR